MRLLACVAVPVAACAIGCGSAPDGGDPSPWTTPDAGPPPPPTVTLPTTTQPTGEAGLCARWSSKVLDLSALPPGQVFAHGLQGGFGIVAAGLGMDDPQIDALALDATGAPRGPKVSLPAESAQLAQAIGTSEGGWLVAWTSEAAPCTGPVYLVQYDANGLPMDRTTQQAGAAGLLASGAAGETDVAWCVGAPSPASQLGTISAFPLSMSLGTPLVGGAQETWLAARRGTFLSLECGGPGAQYEDCPTVSMRTWSAAGQPGLNVTAPVVLENPGWPATWAACPGDDPSTAIIAQSTGVSFLSGSRMLVVPSDVLLNGANPWAGPSVNGAQRAVVAFDGHVEGDGGSSADGLQIVEVSSTGARSVIGQAPLPADPGRSLPASYLSISATLAEDAYMVVLVGPTLEGAVFTCTERS